MPFINSIYKILIYKTRLKYYTVFITLLYKLKAKLALIIISSYYHYLIYCFLFNYIDNFYKSKEYFIYNLSL